MEKSLKPNGGAFSRIFSKIRNYFYKPNNISHCKLKAGEKEFDIELVPANIVKILKEKYNIKLKNEMQIEDLESSKQIQLLRELLDLKAKYIECTTGTMLTDDVTGKEDEIMRKDYNQIFNEYNTRISIIKLRGDRLSEESIINSYLEMLENFAIYKEKTSKYYDEKQDRRAKLMTSLDQRDHIKNDGNCKIKPNGQKPKEIDSSEAVK